MNMPTKVELKIGEAYTLRLPGLRTAGYIWTYKLEGEDCNSLIELSAGTAAETPNTTEGRVSPIGASVDEVFILRALESGHVTIRFTQSRPWEKNQPPVKEYAVEVDITNGT